MHAVWGLNAVRSDADLSALVSPPTQGRLTKMSLAGAGLTCSRVPPQMAAFTQLRTLDMGEAGPGTRGGSVCMLRVPSAARMHPHAPCMAACGNARRSLQQPGRLLCLGGCSCHHGFDGPGALVHPICQCYRCKRWRPPLEGLAIAGVASALSSLPACWPGLRV